MPIPPQIDAAMDKLEALAPLLSAEVGAGTPTLAPHVRAYKEALMTTRVLMEKLRVIRALYYSRSTPFVRCNCDEP